MKLSPEHIQQIEEALEKAGEGAQLEIVPAKFSSELSSENWECSCPYCHAKGPCGSISHEVGCRYA